MDKNTRQDSQKSRQPATRPASEARLSRQRKPAALAVDDWQRALRRQFGREQHFGFENLGDDPVFSEFSIYNPDSRRRYRVVIRGSDLGDNRCSCPDFSTNDLGTCKHIEFALLQVAMRPGGKKALATGFQGSFSEVFLDHAGQRRVRLRRGSDFPAALVASARDLFDEHSGWQLAEERFADLPAFVESVRAAGHELRCEEDALTFIAEIRDREIRRQTLDREYPPGSASATVDRLLKASLYPYQRPYPLPDLRWTP